MICSMTGEVISRGPNGLHDQHRQEERGDWPPAAKQLEDAIGQRPLCSGHYEPSLPAVARSTVVLNTERRIGWPRPAWCPRPLRASHVPGRAAGNGASRFAVALVRAESVRHREATVLGGHERSHPAYENRSSHGLHGYDLGCPTSLRPGSHPTRRDGAGCANRQRVSNSLAPQVAAWGARTVQRGSEGFLCMSSMKAG